MRSLLACYCLSPLFPSFSAKMLAHSFTAVALVALLSSVNARCMPQQQESNKEALNQGTNPVASLESIPVNNTNSNLAPAPVANPAPAVSSVGSPNAAPSSVAASVPSSTPSTAPSGPPSTGSDTTPSTNVNTGTVSNSQPSTKMCGNNQNIILDGTPWLVANSMYGAGSMVGTSCTSYDHIQDSGSGSQVVWSSEVHIQDIPAT